MAEAGRFLTPAQSVHDLGPGGGAVVCRFLELGIVGRADDPVDAAIHGARDVTFPRLQVGIAQRISRRRMGEAVVDLAPACVVEAQSRFGHAREFADRSEEHTSELQSLMRISYAVFCLQKKK